MAIQDEMTRDLIKQVRHSAGQIDRSTEAFLKYDNIDESLKDSLMFLVDLSDECARLGHYACAATHFASLAAQSQRMGK